MQESLEELARRYGVSVGAVEVLLGALRVSGGKLAQFNHPELGGMGQWMPGMTMVGDMFNQQLKARVDGLCTALAQMLASGSPTAGSTPPGSMVFETGWTRPWWPEQLGVPSSSGGQNDLAYAYFPSSQRLALKLAGKITIYDTTGYTVTGVSQQQQAGRYIVVFSSPQGIIPVATLPVVPL
jgi:hypothetical protein